jgi:tRNA-dihydrouridine synthase
VANCAVSVTAGHQQPPAINVPGHSLVLPVLLLPNPQAGRIAAEEGVAGLVLHARHADQQYSPPCHWDAVAQLVAAVPPSVPVIGNGDVFEAADAIQMMRQTGCKGELLPRVCLCIPFGQRVSGPH